MPELKANTAELSLSELHAPLSNQGIDELLDGLEGLFRSIERPFDMDAIRRELVSVDGQPSPENVVQGDSERL